MADTVESSENSMIDPVAGQRFDHAVHAALRHPSGTPRSTAPARESAREEAIPIRGRAIGGRELLAGAVTGAVGLAIGAFALGRAGHDRR